MYLQARINFVLPSFEAFPSEFFVFLPAHALGPANLMCRALRSPNPPLSLFALP